MIGKILANLLAKETSLIKIFQAIFAGPRTTFANNLKGENIFPNPTFIKSNTLNKLFPVVVIAGNSLFGIFKIIFKNDPNLP